MKKLSIFMTFVLILATVFTMSVAAARATVDISKVTYEAAEGEPHNPVTAIFDNDEMTRWGAMNAFETVTAVLDQAYTIESIDIRFFRGGAREHLFTIESSTDGTTWTKVALTKAHSTTDPALGDAEIGYMENFPLTAPVTAQYFRYTFEGRNDGATIGSIWEMYFNGTPAAGGAAVETPVTPVQETAPAVTPTTTAATSAPTTADPIALIALGSLVTAGGALIIRRRK